MFSRRLLSTCSGWTSITYSFTWIVFRKEFDHNPHLHLFYPTILCNASLVPPEVPLSTQVSWTCLSASLGSSFPPIFTILFLGPSTLLLFTKPAGKPPDLLLHHPGHHSVICLGDIKDKCPIITSEPSSEVDVILTVRTPGKTFAQWMTMVIHAVVRYNSALHGVWCTSVGPHRSASEGGPSQLTSAHLHNKNLTDLAVHPF